MGVVPGAILGAGVAIFLSKMLAEGRIDLLAPQANAFATFTILLAENEGNLTALGIGFLLGCFIEWATGMGTSFGLGMYLPTLATFPMLIGGAFLGVESAVFAVVDELPTGEEVPQMDGDLPILDADGNPVLDDQVLGDLSWYPYARFASFVGMNIVLGLAIYLLFRKAGIIGPKDELLDAELG